VTSRRGLIGLLVAASAGFVAIAVDVTHHGALDRLDMRVVRWSAAGSESVESVANIVTRLGSMAVLAGLALFGAGLLVRRQRRTDAALLVASLVGVSLLTNGLKLAFGRPRPQPAVVDSPAFPSGHTSGSVAVFVLLAVLIATRHRKQLVAVAALLAGVVGATRILVEAHWLSDVLAGYCFGVAVVAGVLVLRDRFSDRLRVMPSAGPDGEREAH
jgi:undecaprenyl-diphosphatase